MNKFHALQKEMPTHSSVLAWRIPGTGEPDGLPSMESHRAGHDWSNLAEWIRSGWFIFFFFINDVNKITRSLNFLKRETILTSINKYKQVWGEYIWLAFSFLNILLNSCVV